MVAVDVLQKVEVCCEQYTYVVHAIYVRYRTGAEADVLCCLYRCTLVLPLLTSASLLFSFKNWRNLRVRAVFHKTVRVCHVYWNFKIGFTFRITVIFGTLKDGSLLINTLASNICFSYRNMFQNGVDALSKIVDAFLSKCSKFHLVRIIR